MHAIPRPIGHAIVVLRRLVLRFFLAMLAVVAAPVPAQQVTDYVLTAPPIPPSNGVAVPQTMTATWDNQVMQLQNLDSVFYPEGWALQYQTSSGWSNVPPNDLTTVTGLKASGSVVSEGSGADGTQSGTQVIRLDNPFTVSGAPAIPVAPTFTITQEPGWKVFFDSTKTKVFNLAQGENYFVHLLNCHMRTDASVCAGWPANGIKVGYGRFASGLALNDGRIFITGYVPVGMTYKHGFYCLTTSGQLCPVPFYALAVGAPNGWVSGIYLINNKIYTLSLDTTALLCLDLSTDKPCAGENGWVPFVWNPNNSRNFDESRVVADKSRIYGFVVSTTHGYPGLPESYAYVYLTNYYCYDTVLKRACKGWEGHKDSLAANGPNGPQVGHGPGLMVPISRDGVTIDSVCHVPSAGGAPYCLNPSGLPIQPSAGLFASISIIGSDPSNNVVYSKGRTYPANAGAYGAFGCYDAVKDRPCFSPPRFVVPQVSRYAGAGLEAAWSGAVEVDPVTPNCLWSHSDLFGTRTWDVSGPQPVQNCDKIPAVLSYTASASATRMACPADNPTAIWQRYQFSGAIGATGVRLTVLDSSGVVIPGWNRVPAGNGGQSRPLSNGSGSWDLSSLTLGQTGQQPQFQMEFSGVRGDRSVTASLVVANKQPELCWRMTRLSNNVPIDNKKNSNDLHGTDKIDSKVNDKKVVPGYRDPDGKPVIPVDNNPGGTVKRRTWVQLL